MPNVAVILSGCGHLDGAEIRESVLTLLYLDEAKASVQCFAPDTSQHDVINHVTGAPMAETRNVLVESARIARGNIKPLSELKVKDFDALILPGGFGAAKNLSDFATKGPGCQVRGDVKDAITAFHQQGKPIGAICIAPAVLAAVLKDTKPLLTIGEDAGVANILTQWGAKHENAPSESCVIDTQNRLATCSAYMRNDSLSVIAKGIEKTVKAVLDMAAEKAVKQAKAS